MKNNSIKFNKIDLYLITLLLFGMFFALLMSVCFMIRGEIPLELCEYVFRVFLIEFGISGAIKFVNERSTKK